MISIAMASYNGEKYLCEQIDSILSQTIHHFELVVCDDCSTDLTWKILNDYAKKDNRIRIFRNVNNIGFKENFTKAISLTKGDYIALCDQDDIWMPDHLEQLLNHLGNKMVACGDSLLVDSNNRSLNMTLSYQESLDFVPENDLKKAYSIFYFRSPFQGAGMLIKRAFFDVALPIPQEVLFHDVWFSELSCFYGGMNYFEKPISRYRQHSRNVTGGRIQRRPKLGTWLRKILRGKYLKDRSYAAIQILGRVNDLTGNQRLFLEEIIRHGKRKKTFIGRTLNALFELIHYKFIYSCHGWKWL